MPVRNSSGPRTRPARPRPSTAQLPDNFFVTISINEGNQVVSAMDQLFRTGSVFYNDAGYVTSTLNANNETTSFGYDDAGRLLTITNGRGKTRTYTYKPRHEVDTLTLADGQTESWDYDGNGNISTYTNGLGQVITYDYNSANDQTGVDYPTGTDTSFGYDALGRWNSMTDATGTTSWVHNILGQVTSLTTPQGSYTYAYNAQYGRPETVTDVNGVWSKTYDQWHRSVSTTNPWNETTSVEFDNAGRVDKKTLASGMYETYSYDVMSRLEEIRVIDSSDLIQDIKQYVWDEASRVTSALEGGVTTTYTYDDLDQLLTEFKGNPLSDSRSYTYDKNGNRTTRTVNGVTETYYYNDADKLTLIVGGANPRSYTYDLAGRTNTIVDSYGLTQFGYDYDGRATSITYPNATSDNFGYNGLGARMSSTGVNGSKTFRRAGLGVTSSVLSDGTKEYTPGVSSRQNGTSTFQHSGLKNALDQTDANETVTASRHYDAYGNVVQSSGTWQGAFGYAGNSGYQEDGNGLKLLGHRYYDSDTGRFMTGDPAGDGSNWYIYAGNNPITRADAFGLGWGRIIGGIAGGIIGGIAGAFVGGPLGAVIAGAAGEAAGSFIGSLFDGDDLGAAAMNGLVDGGISLLTGGLFHGAGALANGIRNAWKAGKIACFVAGTAVIMANGAALPIEDVDVGDKVLSYNEDTGEQTVGVVTGTIVSDAKGVYELVFSDGDQIRATAEHPFYVSGEGWHPAAELEPGDQVKSAEGEPTTLLSTEYLPGKIRVYNLQVDNDHTYYAGKGKLVHNKKICVAGLGGVYELVDGAGNVKYVGSTSNYATRRLQHANTNAKKGLRFRKVVNSEDRLERLLYEQQLIEQYRNQGASLLNERNAVGPRNPLDKIIRSGR